MEYTTLNAVKEWGGFDSGDDEVLSQLIRTSSQVIENYTQRVFKVEAPTDQTFTRLNTDHNRFHGKKLFFYTDLAAAAESITDSPTVLYLPEDGPPYYGCMLTDGAWAYPTVTVNGYWGYSKSVPYDIEHACIQLAEWLYDQKNTNAGASAIVAPNGMVLLPDGLPNSVAQLLAPYRKARIA